MSRARNFAYLLTWHKIIIGVKMMLIKIVLRFPKMYITRKICIKSFAILHSFDVFLHICRVCQTIRELVTLAYFSACWPRVTRVNTWVGDRWSQVTRMSTSVGDRLTPPTYYCILAYFYSFLNVLFTIFNVQSNLSG